MKNLEKLWGGAVYLQYNHNSKIAMSIRLLGGIFLTMLLSSCELLDDFIGNENNQGEVKEELAALFKSDYVNGYSAILIEDGYALLSNPNKLCLAKYDFISEEWSPDTLFSVELDSLGRTSRIYLQVAWTFGVIN